MRIERNNSLDTLKVLSIAFIFIWHLQPFQFLLNGFTDITKLMIANRIFWNSFEYNLYN